MTSNHCPYWKSRTFLIIRLMAVPLVFLLLVTKCYTTQWSRRNALPKPSRLRGSVPPKCGLSCARDLLLFSYMRSGSTLTSEVLRDSPGTFFVFEPLMPLAPYHYFTEETVCAMRNIKCSPDDAADRIQEAIDTVHNIYTCKLSALPAKVIDNILSQNKSGLAWYRYYKCLNESVSNKTKRYTGRCLLELERECSQADARLSKILRLDFVLIKKIVSQLPNLNVLLLHRDPRAIINSRIQTDWFPVSEQEPESVRDNIDSLCNKMVNDMAAFEATRKDFGARVTKMDIQNVTNDRTGLLNIFKFINKNVTRMDEQNIEAVMAKKERKRLFRDWTTQLKEEYRIDTEKKCQTILTSTRL